MKKILLFGAYSDNNLGDDLILLLVNRLINRKQAMPLVLNRYGMNDFFTNNYNFVDNFIYNPEYNNKKLKRMLKIKTEKIEKIDTLFFIGGGYSNEKFGIMNLIKMNILINEYSKSKVPIYFFGQTIGPSKSKLGYKILKNIYSKGKKVYVRENYSINFFRKEIKTELVGDDAYLSYEDFEKNKVEKENIIVNMKDFANNDEYYNDYLNMITNISKKINNEIHIVPFRNDKNSKEYKLNYKLYKDLKKKEIKCKFCVIQTYQELINEFSSAITVIGSAYHSVVLGLIAGANVYGIYNGEYYEQKIKGVLNLYDMSENNTISIKNLSVESEKFINEIVTKGLKENEKISDASKAIYKRVLKKYNETIDSIKEGKING